jgi:predicted HicB family RNase H-like nuclease
VYDSELDLFRGKILGLSGGADSYGKNPKKLRAEFKRSPQVFLEVCLERSIEPKRHFPGKFNLRISPDLHERLAIAAQAQGKSINAFNQNALESSLHHKAGDDVAASAMRALSENTTLVHGFLQSIEIPIALLAVREYTIKK